MIKVFASVALILLCSALTEAAILSNITVLPCVPDISLICVLYISMHNGRLLGETTGFLSGLFLDFLSAAPFGLNCLYRTVIGFIGGMFNKTINTEGIIVPALLGFLATLLKALMIAVISMLYPNTVLSYNIFSWMFLIELGINTVLTPIIFKLLSLFKNFILLKPEKVV